MPPETPSAAPLRSTERRNPRSVNLDTASPEDLVALFLREDALVPSAVAGAAAEISRGIALVESAFRGGHRLFYVGAGTSGRLGVLDASECPPTFGTPPVMVQGIIAGGPEALQRSIEGAEDRPEDGAEAIRVRGVEEGDVVVGIAASGTTPFVGGAVAEAHRIGALTMLVTCAEPPAEFLGLCRVVIQVDVGPELVTGSTRLKAGTATKLILNMLTTGALVRLGKTYGNLMVDLQATNAKLRDRGERIVMEVLGVSRTEARAAIAAAGGSVRSAIVMLHLKVDRPTAEARLDAVDHRLRAIVGPPPPIGDG